MRASFKTEHPYRASAISDEMQAPTKGRSGAGWLTASGQEGP